LMTLLLHQNEDSNERPLLALSGLVSVYGV
jgi:hypothetical protein